jgi:hypothetical protein
MKNILLIVLLSSVATFAQFRDNPEDKIDIRSGITNDAPSSFLLGFINPNKFDMHHSISMSFNSFGGQSVALGVYTNNMSYTFNNDLFIEADISLVTSPYSSFGTEHAKSLNGIYLSRAQLNYKPSDNMSIVVQYNGGPYSYYSPYNYYYSPLGLRGIR